MMCSSIVSPSQWCLFINGWLMIDVWCWMFDVKFDVDVAGKPKATFNLWAKGQNEC